MYADSWPIITHQEQLPPAKFVFDDESRRGMALDSLVSGGCIISGSIVRRSLLFSRCRVDSWARLDGAVLLPEVRVNRYARLRNVIRSAERRVGKECVSKGRCRWSPYH